MPIDTVNVVPYGRIAIRPYDLLEDVFAVGKNE